MSKIAKYFKRLSIAKQALVLFLCMVLPISIIISAMNYEQKREDSIDNMKLNAQINLNSTVLIIKNEILIDDYSKIINNLLNVLNHTPNLLSMYVEKKDSNLTLYSTKEKWKILDQVPDYMRGFSKDKFTSKIIDVKQDGKTISKFYASMPIIISGFDWGWIHAEFDLKEYNKSKSLLIKRTIVFFIISLVFAAIIGLYLGNLISKPILKLASLTKQIASGDLNAYSNVRDNKETSILSSNFNFMLEKVKASKEELDKTNKKLEQKVRDRTKELTLLNKTLDANVKKEVQKRHEQEDLLIQQSRLAAMGEMIGNIAHQWRQPLNALGLTIQNLQVAYDNGYLNDAYIKRTVTKSRRLADQMSKTIDDFRNFFQPTQHKERFSLKKSVTDCVEIVEIGFKNNNITIDVDIDENIKLLGHSNQFSQAVLNLLSNAKDVLIEKNEQEKNIKIYASCSDQGDICLCIEDNGGGIQKDVIDDIFTPYFTTKEEGKGTGIGLYMTKMIIEKNMQGLITVSNTQRGAKFTIVFKNSKENRND